MKNYLMTFLKSVVGFFTGRKKKKEEAVSKFIKDFGVLDGFSEKRRKLRRKNNRKDTAGRITQRIQMVDKNGRTYEKTIFHLAV